MFGFVVLWLHRGSAVWFAMFPLNLTFKISHFSRHGFLDPPPTCSMLTHATGVRVFFQAWLWDTDTRPFCSSCAHDKTYWHVVSVFLIMHLVLVDKRPIHQAGQICRAAVSPHHLYSLTLYYLFHMVGCSPTHSCSPTSIFHSLLAVLYPKCSLFIYCFLSSVSPCLCPCYCLFLLSNVLAILAQRLSHWDSSQISVWLRPSPLLLSYFIEVLINVVSDQQ